MTTQTDSGAERSFVNTRLPWIVAVLAGIIYLLTLNPWVSPNGLQPLVRATGQAWFSDYSQPVFNLVTFPFRWLPETSVPVALNLFSAVCAVVVLGLLARSVALLPQDRTQKQRERERNPRGLLSAPAAWIPPVLAVIVCGLQLTFWENATNVSSDMFDLVLFAYAVRCLLEFRIDHRESWLMRGAVIYAVGMSETWVMIALLPAFIVAVIWIRGFSFFQLNFLARFFLCGLAGLLVYFYLPLVHLRSDGQFWQPLMYNVAFMKRPLTEVFRYIPHQIQLLLAFTSLLPLLVAGIRWKSHFGDSSQIGVFLTTWIFHLAHAALLGVCIWAAFDPRFSARDAEQKVSFLTSNRDRLLPLYYLAALSIGYFSGYFLVVFRPLAHALREVTTVDRILDRASSAVIAALLLLAPVGLLYKNIPQIKVTNGPALKQFASALTANLPSHGVLLSDRNDTLLLAQAWLARSGKAANFVFLETHSLRFPAYHRFQKAKHPDVWPALNSSLARDDFRFVTRGLIDLLDKLGTNNPIYYLHPSFGSFFEHYYSVPHGLVYQLALYPTNTAFSAPPMSEAAFAENETFWETNGTVFRELLPAITPPRATKEKTFRELWMTQMRIPFERNPTCLELGMMYSLALNELGIQEQRMGRLEAAGAHFAQAQEFSPDNVVATANLENNRKLRAGERTATETIQGFEDRFGKFGGWEETMDVNGLFDTATGCLAQGIVFARGSLTRQAAQQFERVLSLDPDNQLARYWLARIYLVKTHTPENALPLVQQLKANSSSWADNGLSPADIFSLDLSADYVNRQWARAGSLVQETLASQPPDTNLMDITIQVSMAFGQFTNALSVVQHQLTLDPNDTKALVNKGYIQLQWGQFDQSINLLSQAISAQPTNSSALVDRAIAYLDTQRLDEAGQDYESLVKVSANLQSPQRDEIRRFAYYGLQEVAFRQKNTNACIGYCEGYLSNAIAGATETQFIADRLKRLRTPSP